MPFNEKQRRFAGYAFINFVSFEYAQSFGCAWDGTILEADGKTRKLLVMPAHVQSLKENLRSRKWNLRLSDKYLPAIFEEQRVDKVMDISQAESEQTMRRLAAEEGIFCGVSSGGSVAAALKLAATLENATIVAIICDRGDRYLSTGVFDAALS